ncbi:anthocyanidin 3-O-glucosyltransferase 5-like [Punica granatum]|uniref:Glycosyltransferase n=1 Tax=Punica granatum TaxID=22663 RepID=A0A6P8CR51_PUNGR|nr:anthocyanidin 3-O-glucosyltransferase 5-like [Punica granatum]
METPESRKLHAVLLSSPGMGHIIPIIELGKRLVAHHSFYVTVFVAGAASQLPASESKIIEAAMMNPKLFDLIQLPPVDISGLVDPDATVVARLCVMMREARPAFKAALSALAVCPDVLILDLFSTEHFIIGDELRIPKFVYVASNAWFLALKLYSPTLDKLVEGEYVDQPMPLEIPGCRVVRPEDVVDPMLDRSNQQYREYLRMATELPMGDGILLNIWEDLQPQTLAALRDERLLGRIARVPIYPVGPLIRPLEPVGPNTRELFDWLDRQPSESVIFVSFGSGGTLSADQLTELAWGLELSRQRFIWVLRAPTIKSGDGSFFDSGNGSTDMLSFLPDGFVGRTQGIGLLIPHWAPQVNILAHRAVGGFLSHCGWSSTLESIVNGVPMIAWPLYAEQRMNATLLAEEIGVAICPKVLPSKKTVGREEIRCLVRRIMVDEEGNAARKKVKELQKSSQEALCKGGSSYECLWKLREDCKARLLEEPTKK